MGKQIKKRMKEKEAKLEIQLEDAEKSSQKRSSDFFVSEKKKGKWGVPKSLGKPVNGESYEASAFVNEDGSNEYKFRVVYFNEGQTENIFDGS